MVADEQTQAQSRARTGLPGGVVGSVTNPSTRRLRGPLEVEVRRGGDARPITVVPTDGQGRFLVPYPRDHDLAGSAVQLLARAHDEIVGATLIAFPKPGDVAEASITVEPAAPQARDTRRALVADVPDAPWEPVPPKHRIALADLLRGTVSERDGRPLVPPHIPRTITELNEAGRMAWGVLRGALSDVRRFEVLISGDGASRRMSPDSAAGGRPEHWPRGGAWPAGPGPELERDLPCAMNGAAGVSITLSAAYLDIVASARLGYLTQPGAMSQLAVGFLAVRYEQLVQFQHTVHDYRHGRISPEVYVRFLGPVADREPLPLDDAWMHLRLPPAHPQRHPGAARALGAGSAASLCDVWLDCAQEIATAAAEYQPPTSCPSDDSIGTIVPAVICAGQTGVELEIHAKEGETFQYGGGVCIAWLTRGLDTKVPLETLSQTPQMVKVRLPDGTRSGCIGFRSGGPGGSVNVALIDTCLRLGMVHGRGVLDLLQPAGKQSALVLCAGKNMLTVAPAPELVSHSALVIAEACTEASFWWSFDFGTQDSWAKPEELIRVTVKDEDGTVLASHLPPAGSFSVTEADDRVYTLLAETVVYGSACGHQATTTVAVQRYGALYLSVGGTHSFGPSGRPRLMSGSSPTLSVRSSCPAGEGGLQVQVSSSSSASLGVGQSLLTIPAGDDHATFELSPAGSACVTVSLVASAPGHTPSVMHLDVIDRPVISNVSPSVLEACRQGQLAITGSCYAPDETTVALRKGSEMQALPVHSATASTILCQADDLLPGEWQLEVVSRGLASIPHSIEVVAPAPTVTTFGVIPTAIHPCETKQVWVGWQVESTSRVVIRRDGSEKADIPSTGCAFSSDDLIDFVTGGVTYTLHAYPVGGGTPITRSRTITETVECYARVLARNLSGVPLLIWQISGLEVPTQNIPASTPKHELPAGEERFITLGDCTLFDLVAIDKAAAANANKDPSAPATTGISNLVRERTHVLGKTGRGDVPWPIL